MDRDKGERMNDYMKLRVQSHDDKSFLKWKTVVGCVCGEEVASVCVCARALLYCFNLNHEINGS